MKEVIYKDTEELDISKTTVHISGHMTDLSEYMIGCPIRGENGAMIGVITDVYPDKDLWYGDILADSYIYKRLLENPKGSIEIVGE